jgi:hypothetical protein
VADSPAEPVQEFNRLTMHFYYAYAELLGRYRGLLHVLSQHGLGNAEQLEREVGTWVHPRMKEFVREAKAKLDRFDSA